MREMYGPTGSLLGGAPADLYMPAYDRAAAEMIYAAPQPIVAAAAFPSAPV